jgi:magnesium-transporting ATPase (P-type)
MPFLSQFKSPITILLIAVATLSMALADFTNALIILVITLISSFLGFWQEKGATNAIEELVRMVQIRCRIIRDGKDGKENEWPLEKLVRGDIIVLSADDLIPGDSDRAMATGNNALVAGSIAHQIGISSPVVNTGLQISGMTDGAVIQQGVKADIFAEIEPNQKERIILCLKKASNVVGFLGDGINNAPALHPADVCI